MFTNQIINFYFHLSIWVIIGSTHVSKPVLPPSFDIDLADNKEYLAGIFLNELSECHNLFPKLKFFLGHLFQKAFGFYQY